MPTYHINSAITKQVLFKGKYNSFRSCTEDAVKKNINLAYADLSHRNLSNANLDDALLRSADFTGSNLSGANLSEALLEYANFSHTELYNTCLAYSNLRGCNFRHTSFGATDIRGCDISGSIFSTLSSFRLNFKSTKKMEKCAFINPDGTLSHVSRPPIVIQGLCEQQIAVMDDHIKVGHDIYKAPHKIEQKLLSFLSPPQKSKKNFILAENFCENYENNIKLNILPEVAL